MDLVLQFGGVLLADPLTSQLHFYYFIVRQIVKHQAKNKRQTGNLACLFIDLF